MNKSKYGALLLLGLLVIGVTGGDWTPNQFVYKPSLGARGTAEKDAFEAGLDRIATRLGKEIWVGDPGFGATLQTAVSAIGETNQVILRVPAGTHNLTADLSIPANVSLKVERGATLSIASGKTLTINGGFDAGLYQVFSCTGSGKPVFGNRVPRVMPQWFGAAGDNIADDAIPINQAATAARASACKKITFPNCTGYYVHSATLDLTLLNIDDESQIRSDYRGVRIKCGGTNNLSMKLNMQGSDDRTAGVIGIWVTSTSKSIMDFASKGSEVGILFQPETTSITYNTIFLRDVKSNKIGLKVYVPDNPAFWANENIVIGGNFACGSGAADAECCVKFVNESTTQGIDSWTFYKPSFENQHGTAAVITEGNSHGAIGGIAFRDVRYECSAGIAVAYFGENSHDVIIDLSVVGGMNVPYYWLNAPLVAGDKGSSNCDVRFIGDGPMHRLTDVSSFASAYNDGTYLHVPGFEIINWPSTSESLRKSSATSFKVVDGDSAAALYATSSSSYGIGITVNFDHRIGGAPWSKKLYINPRWANPGGTELRVGVVCFDANGTALVDDTPAGYHYVQGSKWSVTPGTGGERDCYTIVPYYYKNTNTTVLSFRPEVVSAKVGIFYFGSQIKGLEILSPQPCSGYVKYSGPKELPGVLYAANAPTKWHFQVGEKVFNDAPAVGQPQGWICIKRTSTTLSANASGGDATITVTSIAGIAAGDIIGVRLDTGLYHFTTVNGAPAGNTVTLADAIPGSGVVATSGKAVVANLWRAMPNL